MVYMRLGREAEAKKALDESFRVDPFNVRVKNTLAVLDVLSGYAVLETEHFVIRFDRGRDELFARHAARYLEQEVYPELVARLGYEPKEKALFEIFNRSGSTSGHGWFSARMVGLPYVGTVGACAGKMVAIVSPSAMPQKFNWARVLKHEFVHVVNLQQTNFNIPHWFTEALAVRYEGYPPPESWNEVLARRLRADKLYSLDTINLGFIRPANGEDWTLAYCQSELYARYMVEAHGEDAPAKMLAAYAGNLTTREAIRRAFAVEQEEFERGYREFLEKIVAGQGAGNEPAARSFAELEAAVKNDPKNARLLAELAYAYLLRNANPQARQFALAARELDRKEQMAAYVLARLQLLIGDVPEAQKLLEESLDENMPQENVLGLLAGLKLKAGDFAEAERLYRLGQQRAPRHDKWLKALARVYLESRDDDKLAAILERLADLDYDNFPIRKKVAQLALARKDFDAAARWANQALQIDVGDAEVHALAGQALAGRGKHAEAAVAYEDAVTLDGNVLAWRFALADACVQSRQFDKARRVLADLLAVDADYPGADLLLESLPK
jgi:Flp pilus assembly protein TadD